MDRRMIEANGVGAHIDRFIASPGFQAYLREAEKNADNGEGMRDSSEEEFWGGNLISDWEHFQLDHFDWAANYFDELEILPDYPDEDWDAEMEEREEWNWGYRDAAQWELATGHMRGGAMGA